MSRRRIAILGGGMAGLAAAYQLTERQGWQAEYDVDLYQMGWRLGGKGASGRNLAQAARIEEHGLHLWLGFYENAFALLRRCYVELGRPPDAPLATFDQAFTPMLHVVFQEQVRGEWIPWPVHFRPHPGLPGDGTPYGAPHTLLHRLVLAVQGWLAAVPELPTPLAAPFAAALQALESALGQVAAGLDRLGETPPAAALGERVARVAAALQGPLTALASLADAALHSHAGLRRAYTALDLGLAILRGMLADGVLTQGFDAINEEDFIDWLTRHGASRLATHSAFVRGAYQMLFAYPGGDTARPGRLAAGTGLRGLLRWMNYKGAPFFRMEAGMGDVVFAPLYEVLRRRGVRFHFFHRVERLRLAADGRRIGAVELTRQATVRGEAYHPLVEVEGLPCWPSAPLWDQLVEGEQLARAGVNLESAWAAWPGVGGVTLQAGVDFTDLVLAIPVGALSSICAELVAHLPAWARMVREVKTVQTQAMQLWLRTDLQRLGWHGAARVVSGYAEPFDTWLDMTHLLARERWTATQPADVAYFCGPLKEWPTLPPPTDHDFPRREAERVRHGALRWLETRGGAIWPRAAADGVFDWDVLVDPRERAGAARFEAQYWRANVNPSDRYTLSLPGSAQHRLPADGTGLANLVIAGDWVKTGMDCGCIEAATMAGMQAARALCGHPQVVHGETDFPS